MSYKYFNKTANSISFKFGNDTVSIEPQSYFYSETKVPDLETMFGPGTVDTTVQGEMISSRNSSPTFLNYDNNGNILANIIPRTGTLTSLLGQSNTTGELASADTGRIVQYDQAMPFPVVHSPWRVDIDMTPLTVVTTVINPTVADIFVRVNSGTNSFSILPYFDTQKRIPLGTKIITIHLQDKGTNGLNGTYTANSAIASYIVYMYTSSGWTTKGSGNILLAESYTIPNTTVYLSALRDWLILSLAARSDFTSSQTFVDPGFSAGSFTPPLSFAQTGEYQQSPNYLANSSTMNAADYEFSYKVGIIGGGITAPGNTNLTVDGAVVSNASATRVANFNEITIFRGATNVRLEAYILITNGAQSNTYRRTWIINSSGVLVSATPTNYSGIADVTPLVLTPVFTASLVNPTSATSYTIVRINIALTAGTCTGTSANCRVIPE